MSNNCPIKIRSYFEWLNASFMIVLVFGGALLGFSIFNSYININGTSYVWMFTNIAPPYTGIFGGVILIAGIMGVRYAKKLKKEVCNDNINLSLI